MNLGEGGIWSPWFAAHKRTAPRPIDHHRSHRTTGGEGGSIAGSLQEWSKLPLAQSVACLRPVQKGAPGHPWTFTRARLRLGRTHNGEWSAEFIIVVEGSPCSRATMWAGSPPPQTKVISPPTSLSFPWCGVALFGLEIRALMHRLGGFRPWRRRGVGITTVAGISLGGVTMGR